MELPGFITKIRHWVEDENHWLTRQKMAIFGGTLIVIGSVFTPYFGQACLIYMFLYTLSPIITWRIEPEVAARETQTKPAGVH